MPAPATVHPAPRRSTAGPTFPVQLQRHIDVEEVGKLGPALRLAVLLREPLAKLGGEEVGHRAKALNLQKKEKPAGKQQRGFQVRTTKNIVPMPSPVILRSGINSPTPKPQPTTEVSSRAAHLCAEG